MRRFVASRLSLGAALMSTSAKLLWQDDRRGGGSRDDRRGGGSGFRDRDEGRGGGGFRDRDEGRGGGGFRDRDEGRGGSGFRDEGRGSGNRDEGRGGGGFRDRDEGRGGGGFRDRDEGRAGSGFRDEGRGNGGSGFRDRDEGRGNGFRDEGRGSGNRDEGRGGGGFRDRDEGRGGGGFRDEGRGSGFRDEGRGSGNRDEGRGGGGFRDRDEGRAGSGFRDEGRGNGGFRDRDEGRGNGRDDSGRGGVSRDEGRGNFQKRGDDRGGFRESSGRDRDGGNAAVQRGGRDDGRASGGFRDEGRGSGSGFRDRNDGRSNGDEGRGNGRDDSGPGSVSRDEGRGGFQNRGGARGGFQSGVEAGRDERRSSAPGSAQDGRRPPIGRDDQQPAKDSNTDIRSAQRTIAATMATPTPAAPVEERVTRIARELFQLKRQFKTAKLRRERLDIMKSGKKLVYSLSMDPSTQDEKSVALLLNCASFFEVIYTAPALQQAVTWMSENVTALESQHLAMFAHAVVALKLPTAASILSNVILPVVAKAVPSKKLPSVELIMVLQAIVRSKVTTHDKLVQDILDSLKDNATTIKTSELSTLCSIFDSSFCENREKVVASIVGDALKTVEQNIDKVHSNDILLLAEHLPPLLAAAVKPSATFWGKFLSRGLAVCGFFGDRQLPIAFRGFREMSKVPELQDDGPLRVKLIDFRDALEKRLDVCSRAFNIEGFTDLLNSLLLCPSSSTLPGILTKVAFGVAESTKFQPNDLDDVAACVKAIARYGTPMDEVIEACVQIAVGHRKRSAESTSASAAGGAETAAQGDAPLPKELESAIRERVESRQARQIDALAEIRVFAEVSMDVRVHPPALAKELPSILVQRVTVAHPELLIRVAKTLYSADAQSPYINNANNHDILQAIAKRAKSEADFFKNVTTPGFLEEFAALNVSGSLVEAAKHYLSSR